jgi:hypothetical protein
MANKRWMNTFDELWTMLREETGGENPGDETPVVPRQQTDSDVTTGEPIEYAAQTLEPAETTTGEEANHAAFPTATEDMAAAETELQESDLPLVSPLDDRAYSHLADIQKFASWCFGEDGERRLKCAIDLFSSEYTGHDDEIERAIEQGKRRGVLFDKAYRLGTKGSNESAVDDLAAQIDETLPDTDRKKIHWQLKKNYKNGINASNKWRKERALRKQGKPISNVKPREAVFSPTTMPRSSLTKRKELLLAADPDVRLHASDIRCQPPQKEWTLLIDESGKVFDEAAGQARAAQRGRFVGILIPAKNSALEPLPREWHAVDCENDEIDQAMQKLLNAKVGVFGIEIGAVPMTIGERWMDGAGLLVDWVLRLLPVDGPTRLRVRIEQRGVFEAGQSWDIVRRDCLRRLALAYPRRAVNINLEIETITKQQDSFNGYADAVAYTWARTSDSSKARLKQSGLLGTCLLDSGAGADARAMLNALDTFAQGVHLPSALWWDLVVSPDIRDPSAILSSFLHQVGQEAQQEKQPVLWGRFLAEVKSRMAVTPVDLQRLATAVDWLQRYQPEHAIILPALRMVWLTVQLARANHMGNTEHKWQKELKNLGDRLYDESAPLVAHADLHVAVAATNRFDYEGASAALARWRDVPPAVPGLRYWGQIQSSLGQHAAFQGDNARAIPLFREAMSAFERLSDPTTRMGDLLQTGSYLAVSLMDEPSVLAAEARGAIEATTGGLPAAAACLAASGNPSDRYAHHLLLRWLVHRGDTVASKTYIDRREAWKVGDGHPWPLIQLYRGMLLRESDPEAAVACALDGALRAFDSQQGPTVNVIGACCRTVAAAWGTPWPEGLSELHRLKSLLPAAAVRLECLESSLHSPIEPLQLLRSVLPFNFR